MIEFDSTTIFILSIFVLACIVAFFTSKKENFTLHRRRGGLCPPFLNGRDAHLMPNSIVLVVQDYNYRDSPKVIRDSKPITPLQYSWDYGNMAYYLTVDAPLGLCGSEWILETTDFVEPVVYEGRSNRRLNVTLRRRRDGYHWWLLSC